MIFEKKLYKTIPGFELLTLRTCKKLCLSNLFVASTLHTATTLSIKTPSIPTLSITTLSNMVQRHPVFLSFCNSFFSLPVSLCCFVALSVSLSLYLCLSIRVCVCVCLSVSLPIRLSIYDSPSVCVCVCVSHSECLSLS